MERPYTSGELMRAAVDGKALDPIRVLATYAEESNWKKVYADQRCYWAWSGPTICGYELAGHGVRAAAPDQEET